jgi:hypothetical protein
MIKIKLIILNELTIFELTFYVKGNNVLERYGDAL